MLAFEFFLVFCNSKKEALISLFNQRKDKQIITILNKEITTTKEGIFDTKRFIRANCKRLSQNIHHRTVERSWKRPNQFNSMRRNAHTHHRNEIICLFSWTETNSSIETMKFLWIFWMLFFFVLIFVAVTS